MSDPTTRRASQPYRVYWSSDELGFIAYAQFNGCLRLLLAPLLHLANKQPFHRMSSRAHDDEEDAWSEVMAWAADHNDWHGVGHARAMYQDSRRDAPPRADQVNLYPYDPWLCEFGCEPTWVRDLYYLPDELLDEILPALRDSLLDPHVRRAGTRQPSG